ncbi:protein containg conserved repeat domain [Longilinea arvoryzae]|uniref:Protein containg conserved repeat domain n=1 Tax=Longilinea arvoryzae TaxID=360412 RepID=A0A0S7BCC6_9CHLR|nr:FG-GAP-like repeat-containing protein [Longilinea arvoryzae]GAP12416.1 protein containg conserved repeat domain [Longilinea arvoryzae]
MQKTTRILISSLVFVAILFSAIASGKPVTAVQAAHLNRNAQEDVNGAVGFDKNIVRNYIQKSSGGFSQEVLGVNLNVIGKKKVSDNPFGDSLNSVEGQMENQPPSALLSEESLLSNEWSYPIFGTELGISGLNITDIDNDGSLEVVAGETLAESHGPNNRWFVLRSIDSANYEQVYFSEIYTQYIQKMLTADVDGNAFSEIYVALSDKRVFVYSGTDFSLIGSFSSALVPNSMIVTDADGDGTFEIIISNGTDIVAYNAVTFLLIWQTSGYGGNLSAGDVDGDGNSEIVSSRGYVLNSATRNVEWYFPEASGYGAQVAIGDIDGDGIYEIVESERYYKITIYKATSESPMWEITTKMDIDALTLTDVNGDNRPDIVYGDAQWGSLYAIDGQTHQVFWQISNPSNGLNGLATGDTDHDGQLEVVWGGQQSIIGAVHLYVADILSNTIEWQNIDVDGPLYAVDTGDVDDDGQIEIVMASKSSNTGHDDGIVSIFDADTHALEWQSEDLPGINAWFGISSLRIGDVDQDGQTEFVLATSDIYDGLIQIYNGATHTLERQSKKNSGESTTALEIGDVDGDLKMEIVVGWASRNTGGLGPYITVFDGETSEVKWQSINQDTYRGNVYDIQLADVDQDHQVEIIVSIKGGSVYVFNGVTHELKALIPTTAYSLAVGDMNQNGRQSILVGLSDGAIDIFNGTSYVLEKTISFTTKPIACLKYADLDKDEIPEWVVCSSGYLMVYTSDTEDLLWQSSYLGDALGGFNQIPINQIDHDSNREIVVGSSYALYQFESVEADPLTLSRMRVSDRNALPGDSLTYTIEINNLRGETYSNASAVNPLPAGVSYVPDSLSASSGDAVFNSGIITWTGVLSAEETVMLTYQVLVNNIQMPAVLHNSAQLTAGTFSKVIDAETMIGYMTFLPLCTKGCADFLDTFENSTTGWPINNDAYLLTEYIKGEYRLQAKDPQYIYLIMAPTCKRQNYIVEADARWVNVRGDGYGLLFGLDEGFNNYYLFVVNNDYQEYALFYRGANGYEAIVNWQYSALIHNGSSNHLMVTRNGNQITLGINGSVLGTWTDGRVSGLTGVGLFIIPYSNMPNADVRYDNFSVRLLPGGSLSALETTQSEAAPGLSSPNFTGYLQELLPDSAQTDDLIRH